MKKKAPSLHEASELVHVVVARVVGLQLFVPVRLEHSWIAVAVIEELEAEE